MKHLILITTIASSFVLPRPTLAAELPTHVFVSEVNWAGSQNSNADEWLELTNPLEEAIDLSGWSIEGAATSGGTLTIPSGAMIEPHSTYLIANYDAEHSTLNTVPDFVTTTLALSNSGLSLVLRDGSGAEIHRAGDGGSPPAGFSGTGGLGFGSMIWTLAGWISANTSSEFDSETVQFGTPGVLDVEFQNGTEEADATKEAEDMEEVVKESEESRVDESEALEIIVEIEEESEVEEEVEVADEGDRPKEIVAETSVGTFVPTPSFETRTLLINEVESAPANGPEWVELVNPGSTTINLTGWCLQEAGGTSIELSGTIIPAGFAVGFFTSRLNNTGDTIKLIDPSGNPIDELSYSDGQALVARTANGDFVETTTATRGAANVVTSPVVEVKREATTTSDEKKTKETEETDETEDREDRNTTLRLVELLPNPDGEDSSLESITIENFGDELVDLTGWVLTDGAMDYELEGELAVGLKLVLPRPVTHIALNNDEDILELIAPDGTSIEKISYEKSIEGASYIRSAEGFAWNREDYSDESCAVSKSESTDGCEVELASIEEDEPPVAKIKKTSSTLTTLEGPVIAVPATFSSQIMYIAGMQVYQYRGEFPELALGDVVRVTGILSTAYGEPRLKITNADAIQVLGSEKKEPADLSTLETEEMIGELVRVNGTITERGADRFLLEDEGGSLSVILKEATGISSAIMTLGSRYYVTGVMSSYNGELRLLPRDETDIEKEVVATSSSSNEALASISSSTSLPWGYILTLGCTSVLAALAWQHRRRALTPQSI